jgi:hypothetical protein
MKKYKEKKLDEKEKLILVDKLDGKGLIIAFIDLEGNEIDIISDVPALENIESAEKFFDSIEKK